MFELNGTTLAGIGAVLGALVGAVSFVFKQLIAAKDSQIEDLRVDRDYWRDLSMGLMGTTEKLTDQQPVPVKQPRRASTPR